MKQASSSSFTHMLVHILSQQWTKYLNAWQACMLPQNYSVEVGNRVSSLAQLCFKHSLWSIFPMKQSRTSGMVSLSYAVKITTMFPHLPLIDRKKI